MLLEIDSVYKSYAQSAGNGIFSNTRKNVLNGVSLLMEPCEALALVGESGSGKSTLARLILGLEKPDSGEIKLSGHSVADRRMRRRHISAVFQDYTSSINPSQKVFEAIAEPLKLNGEKNIAARVEELMERTGVPPELIGRYPHELSGGQAQRVCLARAIATDPSLLVLDEPLSSLDLPSQIAMLELLYELKQEMSISFLFITHDLQTVAYLCDRVLFFQMGQIVAESLVSSMSRVTEPYAQKLLNAAMPF